MKKNKPDDYFNNGLFEMARFGKETILRSNMSSEQCQKYATLMRNEYEPLKQKIDSLIQSISDVVTTVEPISLLQFSSDHPKMTRLIMGEQSEAQQTMEDISLMRMAEYVQSILVSCPNRFKRQNDEDSTAKYFALQVDIARLYDLIYKFYISWGYKILSLHPEWDALIDTIVESQMLFLVRGNRYQCFEKEYYESLLKVHNDIFESLFGISAEKVLYGINELLYVLSQGKFDSINKLGELMDSLNTAEDNPETFMEEHLREEENLFAEIFGTKLRDVITVTEWPESFVKELSFELGESTDFFSRNDFPGWPIIDLPISKRPFIKIDNHYYCFDYYNFVDNFYRVIQKTITRLEPSYRWADWQQEASEKMVETIFQQILPGCKTYRGNYYPINGSIKQTAENDLLVLYDKILIIVEVKAGSFIYTPPITDDDFESHIKSYKALIEKADWQCKRTADYLFHEQRAKLYDEQHNEKAEIAMTDIADYFMMSVTVDNINTFAARAEKLNFLNLGCNAISIAVDDLMAYREYFDSPLLFLHFLSQRRLATQNPKLALNDELDHLGMYIHNNCYNYQTEDIPKGVIPKFIGYREDLDKYFCSLYHPQLHEEKPLQQMPELFLQIFCYLDKNQIHDRVRISTYLLNFASDAKEDLCERISYTIKKQTETTRITVINASGIGESLRYTCFVNHPQVELLSYEEKRNYTLSTLLWNEELNRVLLDFYFDENSKFVKMEFKKFTTIDVKAGEEADLKEQGRLRAEYRLERYKQEHPGKIGPNQLCPCGSGKKYKKCCGR